MKKIIDRLKNIGPGALVAAGFIGPGTVTTCSVSGAAFGTTLLWAMLFAIISTIILQEMAGRLGIVTQSGLGEILRRKFKDPILKSLTIFLVVSAIFIGNIAYETGNVVGGAMGLSTLFPETTNKFWALVIGGVASILLWRGSYKSLEKFFIGLVILMSLVFVSTAVVLRPNIGMIIKGLFTPVIPNSNNGWMTVIGLIGTTIVPYNLFLHASFVSEKWKNPKDIGKSKLDTIVSIGLGGVISMAIIITAAASFHEEGIRITSAAQMANQLEPLLGSWAKWFFGIGLFSAGFTSTMTAPLSAAFALGGILDLGTDLKNSKVRIIWITVLAVGISFATLGKSSPIEVILFAQGTNALILPIMAIFLMITLNDKKIMGNYRNSTFENIAGVVVILVTVAISFRSFSILLERIISLG